MAADAKSSHVISPSGGGGTYIRVRVRVGVRVGVRVRTEFECVRSWDRSRADVSVTSGRYRQTNSAQPIWFRVRGRVKVRVRIMARARPPINM